MTKSTRSGCSFYAVIMNCETCYMHVFLLSQLSLDTFDTLCSGIPRRPSEHILAKVHKESQRNAADSSSKEAAGESGERNIA